MLTGYVSTSMAFTKNPMSYMIVPYCICLISVIMEILHIHGQNSTIIQEQVIFISTQIYVPTVAVVKMQLGLNSLAQVLIATSLGASIPTQ